VSPEKWLRDGGFGCLHGVRKQHGPSHRTHAPRHRRDGTGDVHRAFKVDVTYELAICSSRDSDIDNDSSGFDVLPTQRTGAARSHDENVGADGDLPS